MLEPRYKHKCLEDFRWKECYDEHGVRHAIDEPPPLEESRLQIVNSWWNSRYQLNIFVSRTRMVAPNYASRVRTGWRSRFGRWMPLSGVRRAGPKSLVQPAQDSISRIVKGT